MTRGGGGSRLTFGAVVGLVAAACLVLATLGLVPLLGLLALVVLGVATLVGRLVPRWHGWIAVVGLALAVGAIAVAVTGLYGEDDPWVDLVLVIWVLVLGTTGCAWGAGIWVGRRWGSRRAPSAGAVTSR